MATAIMAPPEDEVSRILAARNHFEALELPIGLAATAAARRQYKHLAVRVHPDKNRAPGAEDAFKRLSEAYECLSVEQSLKVYLEALTGHGEKATPTRTPARPYAEGFPRKRRSKKRPPPPPQPRAQETPVSLRTPEEVWAQFQREEEDLARCEFHERGFTREYMDHIKMPRSDLSTQTTHDAHESDGRRESPGFESRVRDWTKWKRTRSSLDDAATSASQESEEYESATRVATNCCLLCRRRFPHPTALARHEQKSELHKANLQAQRGSSNVGEAGC